MDILARLKAGSNAVGTVSVNGVEIGLRILTEQDYTDAAIAADALLLKNDTELGLATADVFESEKTINLITRMAVDPATRQPVFPNADVARETLTRHAKDEIAGKYLEHERKFSPSYRTMDDGEFSALLEEVKKNPETPRLNDLSGDSLRRLIASLASQPSSSPTDSGSTS